MFEVNSAIPAIPATPLVPDSGSKLSGPLDLMNFRGYSNHSSSASNLLTPSADLLAGDASVLTGRRYVVTNNKDNGPGSLRDAIKQANAHLGSDTIVFQGLFRAGLANTITLTSGELAITDSLTIVGPGADALTVSGNHTSRIFSIDNYNGTSDLNVTFQGLTISDGYGSYNGGGIYNSENLTLDGVTVSHNTSSYDGGGVYNVGNLNLRDYSQISYNTASFGAGVLNYGTMDLWGYSQISYNSATPVEGSTYAFGGGVNNSGNLSLHDQSSISYNSAGASAGGVVNYETGTLNLYDSSQISHNTAQYGGGVGNNGILKLYANSQISYNRAVDYNGYGAFGGGVLNNGTGFVGLYESSMISDNEVENQTYGGGGISNFYGLLENAQAGINVVRNSPNDIGNPYY